MTVIPICLVIIDVLSKYIYVKLLRDTKLRDKSFPMCISEKRRSTHILTNGQG